VPALQPVPVLAPVIGMAPVHQRPVLEAYPPVALLMDVDGLFKGVVGNRLRGVGLKIGLSRRVGRYLLQTVLVAVGVGIAANVAIAGDTPPGIIGHGLGSISAYRGQPVQIVVTKTFLPIKTEVFPAVQRAPLGVETIFRMQCHGGVCTAFLVLYLGDISVGVVGPGTYHPVAQINGKGLAPGIDLVQFPELVRGTVVPDLRKDTGTVINVAGGYGIGKGVGQVFGDLFLRMYPAIGIVGKSFFEFRQAGVLLYGRRALIGIIGVLV